MGREHSEGNICCSDGGHGETTAAESRRVQYWMKGLRPSPPTAHPSYGVRSVLCEYPCMKILNNPRGAHRCVGRSSHRLNRSRACVGVHMQPMSRLLPALWLLLMLMVRDGDAEACPSRASVRSSLLGHRCSRVQPPPLSYS